MYYLPTKCFTAGLKCISTFTCGLYTGGALYTNVVENPAMLTHEANLAATIWKPSFIRAKGLQNGLVLLSGVCCLGTYACSNDSSPVSAWSWLAAGGMILSVIPVTLVFIRPLNDELVDTEKCISKGDEWIVDNLTYWSRLHLVKTLISAGAFGYMIWLMGSSDG